ncbi:ADP-ribosylglycohydrolase [Hahella chejuensis KCTC 2396]|uniref:ADP-ribosylglycohydrolase n=1 Tax=Hahella chejuensis (strain KCTC 2396) TaxID=349521 RepID=Q2SEN4_HAHCH|nr:ADP-ribosylglycohydrolase family protein [Hahella chejuensis]ABC30890.1 ADP-ribosylglycohydrolase [Hahella chejuensis KCTC 2396]
MSEDNDRRCEALQGSLLGLMVGDAIGLPCEGIGPKRLARLFPGPLQQRLVFGRGMVSDDSEHAAMTAAAMAHYGSDADQFARSLAWRLRWWLARLPAGVGLATGRALIKLWLGFPAGRSGVWSAGNGPAMRAPIIGVALGGEPETLLAYLRASTQLTHRDPKALVGAVAAARAAYLAGQGRVEVATYRSDLQWFFAQLGQSKATVAAVSEFDALLDSLDFALQQGLTPAQFAQQLGLERGVTGYMYHTMPMVLYVWLLHQQDYAAGIAQIVALGGDTDTTAAILGGIVGAGVEEKGIPASWLQGIKDWPFNPVYFRALAGRVDLAIRQGKTVRTPLLPGPLLLLRNLAFLVIVLWHGFRRLAPPY